MSDFKVGERVILNKIENAFGEDQSEGKGLPREVILHESGHDSYDFIARDDDGDYISLVYAKNLSKIEPDTHGFKIDDKVVLVKPQEEFHGHHRFVGKEGTVIKARDDYVQVEVGDEFYGVHQGVCYEGQLADYLQKVDTSIRRQTQIAINSGELAVSHTTNSRKERVSLKKQGRVVGRIRFTEIDQYIDLLTKLKEEV